MSDPLDGTEPGEPGHQALRESLGAYLLGHLTPEEAAEVELHLAGCEACSAEYADLAPVAAALADLKAGDPTLADAGPLAEPVPAGLGTAVEAAVLAAEEAAASEVRHAERRRLLRAASVAGIAAAVAAVVVGVVVVVGLRVSQPETVAVPLEPVAIASEAPAIDASADLVAHTWGVEVKLRATGFDPGARYVVSVLGEGGREYPAGEFVGTGTTEMACNLNSSVLRDRATGFEVRDDAGRVVVVSRF